MRAPVPALPAAPPISAPVPAPSKPPETARSPGVVPQAVSVSPAARIDAPKHIERVMNMALSVVDGTSR